MAEDMDVAHSAEASMLERFPMRDEDGEIRAEFVDQITRCIKANDTPFLRAVVAELHEADLGDLIAALEPDDRVSLVEMTGTDFDFSALNEVDDTVREEIFEELEPETVAEGVRELESDDAVELLETLDEEDQEAVRQHAVAALNLTQKAKEVALRGTEGEGEKNANTAFIEGVRKFAMDVRDLDIDLIDRINPFGAAYAILAKTMSEESLKQVHAVIEGKRINLTIEEARVLAKRALKFKQERGRLPSITSPDAWEKRMAEGVAFLARMRVEAARV